MSDRIEHRGRIWIVRLGVEDVERAELYGRTWQVRADIHGYQTRYDQAPEAAPPAHLLAAAGRVAVYRLLGVEPEVGPHLHARVAGLHVRTASQDWYRLIVHPHEADERIFVFVTAEDGLSGEVPSELHVQGWISGSEAATWPLKSPRGRAEAHYVPSPGLNEIGDAFVETYGRRR